MLDSSSADSGIQKKLTDATSIPKKLTTKDLAFILLNLTGAALACLASILLDYLPFIILEGAWTVVSCFSLIRYLRNPLH